jgi:hypothetical protein
MVGLLWNVTYLQSSSQTKWLINLNNLEFHICLASYEMLFIYNHHHKQKNWLISINWNFLYIWSLRECYLLTIIIKNKENWLIWTNWNFIYVWRLASNGMLLIYHRHHKQKKMIDFNKLEFPIGLVPYGMLLTYNHHQKQRKLINLNKLDFVYVWPLMECYLFTIIIVNKQIDLFQ